MIKFTTTVTVQPTNDWMQLTAGEFDLLVLPPVCRRLGCVIRLWTASYVRGYVELFHRHTDWPGGVESKKVDIWPASDVGPLPSFDDLAILATAWSIEAHAGPNLNEQ